MPNCFLYHRNLTRLLTCVFVLLLPLSAKAVPLDEYHKSLQRAISALDTLTQVDEEESSSNYETKLKQTIDGVRNALPEQQTVQSGSELCNVDNSWLHKDLDEITKRGGEERNARIAGVIETLRA